MASIVVLRVREDARHVHLQGTQDQLWHRERPIAGLAQRNELRVARARHMRVEAPLLAERAFPARLSPAGLIIVTGKDPGLVGKGENILDRRPQRLGAAAGEIGARRAAVRHEQRLWTRAASPIT
jgi:hypothetical protein